MPQQSAAARLCEFASGSLAAIQALLNRGGAVNLLRDKYGWNPLRLGFVGQRAHQCLYRDGNGVKQCDATAFSWFQRAAEKNYADALCEVGLWLKNEASAFDFFTRADKAGSDRATLIVGQCLTSGAGVAKNPMLAMRAFRRAADRGNAYAMFRIGVQYFNVREGNGVRKMVRRRTMVSSRF